LGYLEKWSQESRPVPMAEVIGHEADFLGEAH